MVRLTAPTLRCERWILVCLITMLMVPLQGALAGEGSDTRTLGFQSFQQWKRWHSVSIGNNEPTAYRYRSSRNAVCARADQSASGMAVPFPGSLDRYPVLEWEWKVTRLPEGADGRRRDGDDFAARVYVQFRRDGGYSLWEKVKLQAMQATMSHEIPGSSLVGVWGSEIPRGRTVDSPFFLHDVYLMLRSGTRQTGRWFREQIHIVRRYRELFDREPPEVLNVGIMTDADNTQSRARACYRRIRLRSP